MSPLSYFITFLCIILAWWYWCTRNKSKQNTEYSIQTPLNGSNTHIELTNNLSATPARNAPKNYQYQQVTIHEEEIDEKSNDIFSSLKISHLTNNDKIFNPSYNTQHVSMHNIDCKTDEFMSNELFCEGNIKECQYLSRLQQRCDDTDMDSNKVVGKIDDYLHLLHHHNKDEEFEYISNQYTFCEIDTCNAYQRNHRDRNKFNCDELPSVFTDILDKIHCYYKHSFDIGYRLTTHEKRELYQHEEETETKIDNETDNILVNNTAQKLIIFLSNKRKKHSETIKNSLNRNNRKLSALLPLHGKQKMKQKRYSFGNPFSYGYDSEKRKAHISGGISVTARYKTLKEEITSNDISNLNIIQFNHEYKKAQIYFEAQYCKQQFADWTQVADSMRSQSLFTREFVKHHDMKWPKCKWKWSMSIELVLSVMIYCNYSELQYQFSKTYRSRHNRFKRRDRHQQFFNLGKNLKIVAHKFGTKIVNGNVDTFYHGVGKLLLFDECRQYTRNYVFIYTPLSTTSSFEVALNFTSNNNGMIMYFAGDDHDHKNYKRCTYFSTAWLSDFPYEQEYLFIQNQYLLQIKNILDVTTGVQYYHILDSINHINSLTTRDAIFTKQYMDIPKNNVALIALIIHHQINNTKCGWLSVYGKQLINHYFTSRKQLYIDYDEMNRSEFNHLFDIFCHAHYEWIKLESILDLFENLETVEVFIKNIADDVIDDICRFLIKKQDFRNITVHFQCNQTRYNDMNISTSACVEITDINIPRYKISILKWKITFQRKKTYNTWHDLNLLSQKIESE